MQMYIYIILLFFIIIIIVNNIYIDYLDRDNKKIIKEINNLLKEKIVSVKKKHINNEK